MYVHQEFEDDEYNDLDFEAEQLELTLRETWQCKLMNVPPRLDMDDDVNDVITWETSQALGAISFG